MPQSTKADYNKIISTKNLMKNIYTTTAFYFIFSCFISLHAQPVNSKDSLALVDLYNNTNGPAWKNSKNWLQTPVRRWHGVTVINNRVAYLSLASNKLNGTIPGSIGDLTALEDLDLSSNKLSGNIPASIGNLASIISLSLGANLLEGEISASIGNLINLQTLDLSGNSLTGSIPATIGNLTNCIYLFLNSNKLSGVISPSIGNLKNLLLVRLEYNLLSGNIPPEIGNLKTAYSITLNHNQLNGSVPAEIGNLNAIYTLDLSYNQLTGNLPSTIGNLKTLVYFDVSYNNLSGPLPASVGNMSSLVNLYGANNQFSGKLPSSISKLNNLKFVILSGNKLTGSIPATIFKIPNLTWLKLDGNQLTETENIYYNIQPFKTLELNIENNAYTFNGLEFIATKFNNVSYVPQATLHIIKKQNKLYVSAGGTLNNNTFKWYKVSKPGFTEKKADSSFTPTESGKYYVHITNSIASSLTLISDTINYTIAENSALTAKKIQVFPNPASKWIKISLPGEAIITLTDMNGKVYLSKKIVDAATLNISDLHAGTYYIATIGSTEKQMIIIE